MSVAGSRERPKNPSRVYQDMRRIKFGHMMKNASSQKASFILLLFAIVLDYGYVSVDPSLRD